MRGGRRTRRRRAGVRGARRERRARRGGATADERRRKGGLKSSLAPKCRRHREKPGRRAERKRERRRTPRKRAGRTGEGRDEGARRGVAASGRRDVKGGLWSRLAPGKRSRGHRRPGLEHTTAILRARLRACDPCPEGFHPRPRHVTSRSLREKGRHEQRSEIPRCLCRPKRREARAEAAAHEATAVRAGVQNRLV
jgi:hypothetical protein